MIDNCRTQASEKKRFGFKMVGRYVRRGLKQNWREEDMKSAIVGITKKEITCRKACMRFNVPRSTLKTRLSLFKNNVVTLEQASKKKFGAPPVLSEKQEKELKDHIELLKSRLFNISFTDIRRLAFELAEGNGNNRFNKKHQMAGPRWIQSFFERHKISTDNYKTFYTDSTRVTHKQYEKYFSILQLFRELYNFKGDDIYSVDEFGVTAIPGMVSEVITSKTKVETLSQLEKPGVLVTSVCCTNATGNFVPPTFVLPTEDVSLYNESLAHFDKEFQKSGCMKKKFLVNWLQKFIDFAKPAPEKPVLLLIDGSTKYAKSLEFVSLARQNNVHLLSFPLNGLDIMQPLGCFLSKLSECYGKVARKWVEENQKKQFTCQQIPPLFNNAFEEAAISEIAIKGFKVTGIVPLDRTVFSDNIFESSESRSKKSNSDLLGKNNEENLLTNIPWFVEFPVTWSDPLDQRMTLRRHPKSSTPKPNIRLPFWRNKMKKRLKDTESLGHMDFSNEFVCPATGNMPVLNANSSPYQSSMVICDIRDGRETTVLQDHVVLTDFVIKQEPVDSEELLAECQELLEFEEHKTNLTDHEQLPVSEAINQSTLIKTRSCYQNVNSSAKSSKHDVPDALFESVFCGDTLNEVKIEVKEEDGCVNEDLSVIHPEELNSNENDFKIYSDFGDSLSSFDLDPTTQAVQPLSIENQLIKCSECDCEFRWKRDLISHQITEHKDTSMTKKVCRTYKRTPKRNSIIEGPNRKPIAVQHFSSAILPAVIAPSHLAKPSQSSNLEEDENFFSFLKNSLSNIPEEKRHATKVKVLELVSHIAYNGVDPSSVVVAFKSS